MLSDTGSPLCAMYSLTNSSTQSISGRSQHRVHGHRAMHIFASYSCLSLSTLRDHSCCLASRCRATFHRTVTRNFQWLLLAHQGLSGVAWHGLQSRSTRVSAEGYSAMPNKISCPTKSARTGCCDRSHARCKDTAGDLHKNVAYNYKIPRRPSRKQPRRLVDVLRGVPLHWRCHCF